MSKSLEKIRDIKSLINEVYQDELNEGARKSWLCFKQYCDDIKQDLERLEILDKLVTDDCIAGNQVGLDIINNLIERANKYKEETKRLEKENQELKEQVIDISNKEQLMTAYYKDYKKAIEIIKNKCFRLHLTEATDEEYDLLKEVLEND